MTSEPTRLLDDPSAAGAALRSDLMHASEAQAHGLNLTAGLAQLQAATAAGATAGGGISLTKLGVGALVVAGVAAIWLGTREPASTPAFTPGPTVEPVSVIQPSEPRPPVMRPAPAVVPDQARALDVTDQPTSAVTVPEVPADAPMTSRPASRPAPRRHAKASVPNEPTISVDDSILREARLVAKARANLSGNPARALALIEELEHDFPRGQLIEERRAIAIRALVAVGRVEEAERRSKSFLATYGRGAHAAAVKRALADAPR